MVIGDKPVLSSSFLSTVGNAVDGRTLCRLKEEVELARLRLKQFEDDCKTCRSFRPWIVEKYKLVCGDPYSLGFVAKKPGTAYCPECGTCVMDRS